MASPSAQEEMRAAAAAGLGQSPGAKIIFGGFFIGLIYKALNVAFKTLEDVARENLRRSAQGGVRSAWRFPPS